MAVFKVPFLLYNKYIKHETMCTKHKNTVNSFFIYNKMVFISQTHLYYVKEHWYTTEPQKESTTPNTGTQFPFHSELHKHKPNCLECCPCLILLTYLYRSFVKQ